MKFEEAFAKYLGQEVLVYTVSQGGSLSSVIDCTLEEIGDGWVRVTQGDDKKRKYREYSQYHQDKRVSTKQKRQKENGF